MVMRRLEKADPAKQLPPGVKPAKWVPIIIIPSLGVDERAAGTKLANMRRQGNGAGKEGPVRIRFGACCEEHRAQIKLDNLASAAEIARRARSLTDHMGHGRLDPERARIEWVEADPHTPCVDCFELATERENQAQQARKGAA
jgi:hypothetical protein